jgi:hypothetical protein
MAIGGKTVDLPENTSEKMQATTAMLREGYDPPISRSLKAVKRLMRP